MQTMLPLCFYPEKERGLSKDRISLRHCLLDAFGLTVHLGTEEPDRSYAHPGMEHDSEPVGS